MNSWLQTACQPNSFWYGTTRSSMNRRPRSVARRAGTISGAPTLAKAACSSASALTSSFISHRARILSQLRSSAEFWRRPRRTSSTLPCVSSMTALRLSVALSCAKFSIQWIFQWRSCMSMASSKRTARSARLSSAFRSSMLSM